MNEANQAVVKGMELSDGARESLNDIVERVSGLESPVKMIVRETAKVAELAAEASVSIDEVSQATQSNSAAAEQMSASTEGVSDQVGDIARMAEQQTRLVADLTTKAANLQNLSEEMALIVLQFKIGEDEGLQRAA